jgi:hypothetical protein
MKYFINYLLVTILIIIVSDNANAQKKDSGSASISSEDLQSYVSFLSSPLLAGRKNGEPGLEIAQQYIISQAKLIGLRPAATTGFLQPYSMVITTIDKEKTSVEVISDDKTIELKYPVYQLVPQGPSDFTVEGEVVFAGYGIRTDTYKYNDFSGIKTEDKVIMVMSGAPADEKGKYVFEGTPWSSFRSIQVKLSSLLFTKAKAVIIVSDPRSGHSSFEEQFPGYAGELASIKILKGEKNMTLQLPGMPKILFVHRAVADELLKNTGHTLEGLQKKIDSELKPQSFAIEGKKIKITEVSRTDETEYYNIAASIEGSDPVLKNEFVIFSGHADHIGEYGDQINTGADDNASGCAALLSIAEAFQNLDKKPLRSILFLWVSGEEIGLYGSKSYVNNPIVPLEKTVVDLNMDMIGRVKEVADSTEETPMTGPTDVFLITDNQSKDLRAILEDIDKGTVLNFDYSLSPRDHPLQLFSRSDQFNFVKKDIPAVFFSTGLHSDYHTSGDTAEKIDFEKMELVTKAMYETGYTIANKKSRLVVDNPYSKWQKN